VSEEKEIESQNETENQNKESAENNQLKVGIPSSVSKFFSEKRDKKALKNLQNDVKKDTQKDPYHKQHLFRKNVEFMAGRSESLKEQMKRFNEKFYQRKSVGQKIQRTNDISDAKNELKQYQQLRKEEDEIGKQLKFQVFKENTKRVIEGPKGCLKDLKGCLFSAMVCLTLCGGGILAGILKLCGIF